jgi:H+/gluconate symporter-like permease
MHERYAFAALVFLAPLLAHRPIQVTWGILAVAISLNVAAGAPPDEIGPIVPINGLMGTAGSVAMIVATGVALFSLVRRGPSVGGRDAPGTPPDTSAGSGAATS